jgi:hypothetical protein
VVVPMVREIVALTASSYRRTIGRTSNIGTSEHPTSK